MAFSYWKTLGMFGTSWVCESNFSTVNFMKFKYRTSIFNENLAWKLRCANLYRFQRRSPKKKS